MMLINFPLLRLRMTQKRPQMVHSSKVPYVLAYKSMDIKCKHGDTTATVIPYIIVVQIWNAVCFLVEYYTG